jgi:hypothetical protein
MDDRHPRLVPFDLGYRRPGPLEAFARSELGQRAHSLSFCDRRAGQ